MVTWEVKITPINIAERIVSVSATRTDGNDIRTFSVLNTKLKTKAQKLSVGNDLKAQYEASIALDVIHTEITNLEQAAKAWLEENA